MIRIDLALGDREPEVHVIHPDEEVSTVHRHRRPATTAFALLALGLLLFGAIPSTAAASVLTDIGSSRNPAPACTGVTFSATVYGIIPPPLGGVIFFDGGVALGAEVLSPGL